MRKERITKREGFSKGVISLFIIFNLIFFTGILKSQEIQWGKESLTRGKVWVTLHNAFRLGEVDLPWTYYTLDYPGYSHGADPSDRPAYIISGGYMIYGERGADNYAYSILGVFYPSSQYVYPTRNAQLIKNYNLLNLNLKAEEIFLGGHHVKDLDVDVNLKGMVWSFPKYDDFVILEISIKNTGSTLLENMHFGIRLGVWITQRGDWIGPGSDFDDKYGWDKAHNCFYFYDDRSFNWETEEPVQFNFGPGPTTGDIGDPADITDPGAKNHEIMSPGYMTLICLDSAGANVYQNILQYLGQTTSSDAPREDIPPRLGTDPPSRFLEVMTHQQPRLSWDEARARGGEGGNKYERSPEFVVSCGPHDIAPDDSVKLVYAIVLGEMDRHRIVEGGVENIQRLATDSKDSLLKNVEAARELYSNGYYIADPPPMTPTDGENTLVLTPVGGGIKIQWPPIPDTYVDPVKGVNDFAGYKVYRSSYFCAGPWDLVARIPKDSVSLEDGLVTYTDEGLSLGVGYYYTVTSYDENGNESGKVNPNRFPVYPLRAPNENFPKNVYVVPNPFRQHSGLLGVGEELRMEFIGLPAKCTIKIYTLAGELVRTIHHDDGSGSESWGSIEKLDYQTNRWMLYVSPGVYIFHVQNEVPGHEDEYYIGKFAIIK